MSIQQHITKEHLMQLSTSAQATLRNWWLSTVKDDNTRVQVSIPEDRGTMLPLLSIGDLIAFLNEYDNDDLAFRVHLLIHKGARTTGDKWSFDADALLTTLWEATKAVLHKQQ